MSNLTHASATAPTDRPVPAMVTATAAPIRLAAPGAKNALITAELFTSSDPDDPRTVAAVYGESCADADLDSTRYGQFLTSLEAALPRMRAQCAQLAALEQGTATPAAEPRTFTFPLRDGGTLTETCPPGCTADHQAQTERREDAEDIWHHIGDGPALPLTVFDAEDGTAEDQFLSAQIMVAPRVADPRLRVPHVNVEIAQDYSVMEGLTPDEFGAVIDKLAAHVDQLRAVHARLVQAHAEWQEHQA